MERGNSLLWRMDTNADGTIDYNPLEAHTKGTALPDFSSKIKVSPPALYTKSSPHKNIPLTVAQHFPARRRTLSCMYKNILLTVAQDFMAQYRLFCKHTTHKNTIELFSNIETCFTIFFPFVVHSLIIIFYKGLNFVYFPVWPFVNQAYFTSTFFIGFKNSSGVI